MNKGVCPLLLNNNPYTPLSSSWSDAVKRNPLQLVN
jgi:hypothetical protein